MTVHPYIYQHPDGRILLCHQGRLLGAEEVDAGTLKYLQDLYDQAVLQLSETYVALKILKNIWKERKGK